MRAAWMIAVLVLAGCATRQPIIDARGVHPARYQQDLADCRSYADQVDPAAEALGSAVTGGLIGALFGAALGSITGDAGLGAQYGGISGAGSGAISGTSQGLAGRREVLGTCMANRGYAVLRS